MFCKIKRLTAVLAAGICFASALISPIEADAMSPYTPFPIAFQQDANSGAERQRLSYIPELGNWCDYPWNRGTETGNTVGKAACSLFSVINNIYYNTGIVVDPTVVAQYALDHNYRRVGYDGVLLDFFGAFVKDFGSEYGMKYYGGSSSASTTLAHVRNGGSASANIYGHWIAIVDYDAESDSYLILDSSQTCYRCGSIDWTDRSNGVAWLPSSVLMGKYAYGKYGLVGGFSILFSFDYQFEADAGDADSNGSIDVSDATTVLTHYSYESADMEPIPYHPHPDRNVLCEMTADINDDDAVNIDDANIILEIYSSNGADISGAAE